MYHNFFLLLILGQFDEWERGVLKAVSCAEIYVGFISF